MPQRTVGEIPAAEQAQMLAALRRARSGFLLTLPLLRLGVTARKQDRAGSQTTAVLNPQSLQI